MDHSRRRRRAPTGGDFTRNTFIARAIAANGIFSNAATCLGV